MHTFFDLTAQKSAKFIALDKFKTAGILEFEDLPIHS
jgi:hypothetical protein